VPISNSRSARAEAVDLSVRSAVNKKVNMPSRVFWRDKKSS